jgi:hypothetical protein
MATEVLGLNLVPSFKFAINLKFREIESMHATLPSFARAEELVVMSKPYDTLEEISDDAGDVLEGLIESLERKNLGTFKIDVERNLTLFDVSAEPETEQLAAEIEDFDAEEWAEGELTKMWIYEVESNPDMIIPVALIQIYKELVSAPRLYS